MERMPPELIELVKRDYGLDYSPKSYFEKIQLDSLDESIIMSLRKSGLRANYLSDVHNLLDVGMLHDTIHTNHIDLINEVAGHITFLNLSDVQLDDELLAQLKGMEHLTRLNLSNNDISESVFSFVKNSKHLESINLNDTNINLEQLIKILQEINLQSLYVMNSGISEEELSKLREQFTAVEIISKFKFKEVEKAKSVFEKQAEEAN
jgi:Leucine-rich repeat (LRR) protein